MTSDNFSLNGLNDYLESVQGNVSLPSTCVAYVAALFIFDEHVLCFHKKYVIVSNHVDIQDIRYNQESFEVLKAAACYLQVVENVFVKNRKNSQR